MPATSQGSDDVPTVAEPAPSSRAGGREASDGGLREASTSATGSRVTSVITPRETLHLQEIGRTRAFGIVSVVFAAVVLAALPLVGGDAVAKGVFAGALAVIAVGNGWLAWSLRGDAAYSIAFTTVVALLTVFGGFTGIWFFGVFSPAPMVLPFGIAFFSVGQSARAVLGVYVACALVQLGLMLLVTFGGVHDPGLVRADALGGVERLVVVAMVQATLLATYVVQRRTRAATLYAIEQHDAVVRSLAQRDALLLEARQELAQALQGGGLGRWTDQTVGSFRLGRVLGRGAMGEVYEGFHVTSEAPAAVKLLHPHVLAQADLVTRFVREARVVAALDVPNVVRVLEVAAPDAPVPFLAMERLVGTDLAEHLREHRRLNARSVVAMLRQVGAGLEAAHRAGVVHRDLKPRNLFLTSASSVWKILDFGVARVSGEETLTLDQIVGTPNYMAPEQANGRMVTPRADLFALGVIAYRTLTGRPAFEGQTTAEILYKVVHEMPPRPSALAPLRPDLDAALAIAMAKDPDDRFASASELAAAVEAASRGRLDEAVRARAARLLSRLPWSEA